VNDFMVIFLKEVMKALGDSRIDEFSVCMAPSNAVNVTLRKGSRHVRWMHPMMEAEQFCPNVAVGVFQRIMGELK
jgi:hypothetical protein